MIPFSQLTKKALALMLMQVMLVATASSQGKAVVSLKKGKISGTRSTDQQIISFKAIPFAAPPVGPLRWKAPQPVSPWQGIKDCTRFSASPMQPKPAPFSMWSSEFLIPKEPISEDCLYLNVWTSSATKNKKKPVLVWIYGGGFSSGGSACPIYDGETLARKGIVVVSINYRVGIFGFFAHPELINEGEKSGNFGLLDQIAALKWVKENIEAFGGDPAEVSIAGKSAGAMSVNSLVASPLAAGLFNKAIAQSGANFTGTNPTKADAEQHAQQTIKSLGAGSLQDLRKMDAETVLKKGIGMRRPYVDDHVLPDQIAAIFRAGRQNKVALLHGWNEDEGLVFGGLKNATDFVNDLRKTYGRNADFLIGTYRAANDTEAAQAQMDMARDQVFGLHGYLWIKEQNRQQLPVYAYRFTRIVPAEGEYKKFKAFHTGEVPYAFNNLGFVKRPWMASDHQLANNMSDFWVNFVKSGNPNGKGLPEWPAFDSNNKKIMVLDEVPSIKILPDAERLELLWKIMQEGKPD
jgi:para-nitrobenzyl esterase